MDTHRQEFRNTKNSKFNYNGLDKYKSLVFLSQRFGQGTLNKQENGLKKGVESKEYKTHDPEQMFNDVSIADKIRILRKPVYQTHHKIILKNQRAHFYQSVQCGTTTGKPRKPNQTSSSKIKVISKRKLSPSKLQLNVKNSNKNIKLRKNLREKQDSEQIYATDRKIFTDRSSHTILQLEASTHVPDRTIRCQTEMREQLQKKDIRWASKSSLQWIGQDCGKLKQDQQDNKKSKKKTVQQKNKDHKIPKSCLYMSMYLRIRERQDALLDAASKKAKETQTKSIQITKIPSPVRNRQYQKRAAKFMLNNFNYAALASKFRSKNDNTKAIQPFKSIQSFNDLNSDFKNEKYAGPKLNHKSQSRKRYRPDSKMSLGKGPTITIDPW